jgi:hypothetical protein
MTNFTLLRMIGIRLWIRLFFEDIKSSILRNILCRFGWHHTYPSGERYEENSRGIMLHTYYIKCHYCDRIYFPTRYQKEMHMRIKERERQIFKNTFQFIQEKNQKERDE